VFVQEGIYDQVEKKLVEKAKAWVIGDPFDPKTQQGPQVRSMYNGVAEEVSISQPLNHRKYSNWNARHSQKCI